MMDIACVARTVKNRRCREPLEYGQVAGWTRLRSTGGLIEVYDLEYGSPQRPLLGWMSWRATTRRDGQV